MVIKDKDTKNLVVPASLGNFGNAGGGEGGITPEEAAEIASAITENALDEYDTELQVDLEDMREAISANTQSIEDLSGATGDISAISAQTEENTQAISAISQDIEDLSGATGSISSDLDALSGVCEGISSAVSANTDNITSLSAKTSANTEAIEALSGVSVDIATLSAQTSANTANIEALSAATSALSITVETISGRTREKVLVDVYAVDNMSYADRIALWDEIYAKVLEGADVYATGEVQNTTQRAIVPLSQYVAETEPSTHIGGFLYFTSKAYGENLEIHFSFSSAGNLSGLSGSSKFNRVVGYTLPTASATIKGGVKVGSGLTIDSEKLSVKIGDGLGFSGDTLVVSGGTGGGGTVFTIYDTFAANTELANFLFQYWDENGSGQLSSGYPKESTHIYLWLGQDFQGAFTSAGYGFVELQPQVFVEDEGMAVILTGVFCDDYMNGYICRQGYRQNGDAYACYIRMIGDNIPRIASVGFGNDDIGGLSYNTSTGLFTLGGNTYASGDTTTPVQDVYDYNFVVNGLLTRTGEYSDEDGNVYRCINAHTLYVSDNGVDYTLTSPSISMKGITSYTVDDIEFNREITFNYGDWKLIMDVAESNVGINLRVQVFAHILP